MPRTVSFEPSTLEKLGTFLMQSGGVLGNVARQRVDDEEIRQRTLERLARMLEGLQGQQFQAQHLELQRRQLAGRETEAEQRRKTEEALADAAEPQTRVVTEGRPAIPRAEFEVGERMTAMGPLQGGPPFVIPTGEDVRGEVVPAQPRVTRQEQPTLMNMLAGAQARLKRQNIPPDLDVLAKFLNLKALAEPKAEDFTLSPGQKRLRAKPGEPKGEVIGEVPEKPEKPEAPTSERTIREAAVDELREAGTLTPTEGQIARRALVIKERLAKAGKTEITLGAASEREAEVKARGHLEIAKSIEETMTRRSDLFGGPLGVRGRKQTILEMFDKADPDFPDFRANVDKLRAEVINALAGAAIGPEEAKNYLASVPQMSNSSQQFRANVRVTVQNISALQRYRADVLKRGFQPGQAGAPAPPPPAAGGGSALPPGFKPGRAPR